MFTREHLYKGKRIHWDEVALKWIVFGYGTSSGGLASNVHVFHTLRAAKAFIDHRKGTTPAEHGRTQAATALPQRGEHPWQSCA